MHVYQGARRDACVLTCERANLRRAWSHTVRMRPPEVRVAATEDIGTGSGDGPGWQLGGYSS